MLKKNVNSSSAYQHYSVNDFDSYDCLKLSKRFYLALLFLLRGYLVWLMSVTNMQDRVSIIQWIYPQKSLFYLSLLSGVVGLYVLLIISLRRPEAAKWVQSSWRYCRVIIVVGLLFDLLTHGIGLFFWQFSSATALLIQALITVLLITLCFSSERLNLNLKEFPQQLPEK